MNLNVTLVDELTQTFKNISESIENKCNLSRRVIEMVNASVLYLFCIYRFKWLIRQNNSSKFISGGYIDIRVKCC